MRFESLQTSDRRLRCSVKSLSFNDSSIAITTRVNATRNSLHKLNRSGWAIRLFLLNRSRGGKTPCVRHRFTQGGQQQLAVKPRFRALAVFRGQVIIAKQRFQPLERYLYLPAQAVQFQHSTKNLTERRIPYCLT